MKETSYLPAQAIQLSFLAIAMGAWFIIGRTGTISPLFVPPMEAVGQAFLGLVQTNQFWSAVRTTLTTISEAYGIAIASGILIGYLVTRSRFLTQVLEPLISGLFAIPITLFFPL